MRVSRFLLAFCAVGILAGKNKNKENKKDKKKKKQLKNSQQGMASNNIKTPISDLGKTSYPNS